MHRRERRLGAFTAVLLAACVGGAARADQPSKAVDIELAKAPLSQVIQLLATSANVDIFFSDPEGKLADRQIPYIRIHDKTIDQALETVCQAANVHVERNKNGVYMISASAPVRPTAPIAPTEGPAAVALPAPAPVPEESVTQKVVLKFMDPNECVRFLSYSHTGKPVKNFGDVKSLDDLDVQPGLIDPASGNWYFPQSGAPQLPPIFAPDAQRGLGGAASGNQFIGGGGGFGGGGGGFPGGGGGFGGPAGFGGQGLGGSSFGGPGAGFGGGGGAGGLGGGVNGLVPPGITGIIGYPLDNSLLVTGPPEDIEALKRIIRLLDIAPQQLSIKIEQIAVTNTFQKNFGIDWNVVANDISVSTNIAGGTTLTNNGGINVGVVGNGWRAVLNAAITQGKGTIIDSATITTMNNVPATLFQNTTTYIFLPQTTAVQGAGVQTNFNIQPLSAPTILFAWPRINGDGTITMNIPFTLSRFVGESVGPNGQRVPNSVTTSLNALRRVGSGQTIVVGGVVSRDEQSSSSGIPLLKDLPFIGSLFRTKNQSLTGTETLFFFTPTILPDPIATGEGQ